jgi:hypothetical protein
MTTRKEGWKPRQPRHVWTAADDQFLVDHQHDMTQPEIARHMGMTLSAIAHRRRHLGLGCTGLSPDALRDFKRANLARIVAERRVRWGTHAWTDEEDDRLRSIYLAADGRKQLPALKIMAADLGVTLEVLHRRAKILKVHRQGWAHTWTPQEDAVLIEWCGLVPDREIAKRLHLDVPGVRCRKLALGITSAGNRAQRLFDLFDGRNALRELADTQAQEIRELKIYLAQASNLLSDQDAATALDTSAPLFLAAQAKKSLQGMALAMLDTVLADYGPRQVKREA